MLFNVQVKLIMMVSMTSQLVVNSTLLVLKVTTSCSNMNSTELIKETQYQ
jgi:hypothetical protein